MLTFDLGTGNEFVLEAVFPGFASVKTKSATLRALMPMRIDAKAAAADAMGDCPAAFPYETLSESPFIFWIELGTIQMGPVFPHVMVAREFVDRIPIAAPTVLHCPTSPVLRAR